MTKPLNRKQLRKKKLALLRLRLILLLLVVLIGLGVCVFTPIFNIKSIEVTGNEQVSTEKIIQTAAIPENINMFKVNKKKIEKALLQYPEIESVTIRRGLPPKIKLDIKETRAALLFPYMRGYAATDINGKVMAHFEIADGLQLLTITGVKTNNAEICKKIDVQDEDTYNTIMDVLSILQEKDLVKEMRSAHFDNPADIHFYTKEGVKVIFGKIEDMEYKASMLANVLPQVNRAEDSYIDLTNPSRTVYGTIDPEPVPEEGEEAAEDENKETEEQAPQGEEE